MRRLSLVLIASVWASVLPSLTSSAAARAASSTAASKAAAPSLVGDFNGDGYADLAIGAPGDMVGTKDEAGAVNVIYGSAAGLTSSGTQLWNQDSSGISGTAGTEDHFGQAVAAGDFNGDGFDDLAIGVPDDDPDHVTDAGVVNVIYGSASGLSSSGNQKWSQNSSGIDGTAGTKDAFGRALATGDFDGDGFADLAIGVPHDNPDGVNEAGVVNVIYGSASGLSSAGNQKWSQNSPGIDGTAGRNDIFGRALAAGDLDGDGFADVAVGVPGDNPNSKKGAGVVNVIYGGSGGLSSAGNQRWNQDSSGISDSAEAGDNFGLSLAIGDFGHSAEADLAVGVPNETLSNVVSAGAVNVIYGTPSGLSSTNSQLWSENSAGIVGGPAATADQFGYSLAAGDLGNGTQSDLAVGVPGKDVGADDKAGAVNAIYGGSGGLSTSGNQQWNQDSPNIQGVADPGDNFGYAVGIQDFGNSAEGDLVAGVPNEDVSQSVDAGLVNVIYGTATGLQSTGNQKWNQGSGGILGTLDDGDFFGQGVG